MNQEFPPTSKKMSECCHKNFTVKTSHIWFYQNIVSFLSEDNLLLRMNICTEIPFLLIRSSYKALTGLFNRKGGRILGTSIPEMHLYFPMCLLPMLF